MTRVLMFGWEFPPYKSGGLGTACYDLAQGLNEQKVKITFVMPFAPENAKARFVKLIGTGDKSKHLKLMAVSSPITPYMTSEDYDYCYSEHYNGAKANAVYGKNLFEEVRKYSIIAGKVAKEEEFDIIHAHDWMTYQAGINAKKATGKPLVVHLHATEFDRTGGNPDPRISHIEYMGMKEADRVITNSEFSKQNILKHYKIKPEKIEAVHWAIRDEPIHKQRTSRIPKQKTVIFLGRITIQKGPEYFVNAAKKVLEYEPDTRFVMAGSGDMMPYCIDLAAKLGIADKFVFTGFLKGDDVHRAFQEANLFVMPSVSEPFGLVALESIKNGTPAIVSKTSGVSEVLNHALKVDFWDVDEMANMITAVLRYTSLQKTLTENSMREVDEMTLDKPAIKVKEIYKNVLKEAKI